MKSWRILYPKNPVSIITSKVARFIQLRIAPITLIIFPHPVGKLPISLV